MKLLTFLSDFGLEDEYVASCKGVIKSIANDAEIIDISHSIPSFDVRTGAFVLAAALPNFPAGVHLAVVDPGVGTSRLLLAIHSRRGDILVGPDNSLLIPAAERLGWVEVRKLENKELFNPTISSTFQARDMFAPAAAHLLNGFPFEQVGEVVERSQVVSALWGRPQKIKDKVEVEVISIDKFGSIRFNLDETFFKSLSLPQRFQIVYGVDDQFLTQAPLVSAFGQVDLGEPLFYLDSSGFLALGFNQDSAASRLGVKVGAKGWLQFKEVRNG